MTDPLGNATTYTYDAANRQTEISDPLGNTSSYAYDGNGNRTSMTDAVGIVTRYEYDALSRLSAVVENYVAGAGSDAETNVRTEYTYDGVGNRLTIKDANGNTTTFTYSATNLLASEEDPLQNTISYGYDPVGNRSTLTDALGNATAFTYDENNRLTEIDYPAPDADVTFAYDAAGNRTSMTDGVGTTTWSYDALNRITAVTDPFGDTVSYAYDEAGNRTSLTYPDAKSVSYDYDPANRLTQVTDWSAQVTGYTYDAADRLASASLPNGVDSTYSYNAAGWVTSIDHIVGAEMLSSFQYTYDAVGNRISAAEELAPPSGVASISNRSVAALSDEDTLTRTRTSRSGGSGAGWFPASLSLPESLATPFPQSSEQGPTATQSDPSPTATDVSSTLTPTPEPETVTLEPTSTPSEESNPTQTATPSSTSQPADGDWVVNSTTDGADVTPGDGVCDDGEGSCTLRAAIEEANASPGADVVTFDIAGSGPHTIRPRSPLPEITDPLSIDGSTEPGYEGEPIIGIDGSQAGHWADGLRVAAGQTVIRELALWSFSRAAIFMSGPGGNVVSASVIGMDASDPDATGNHIGVLVEDSPGNRIGGEGAAGNIIAGNMIGVYIVGSGAGGNSIEGNRFGLHAGRGAIRALQRCCPAHQERSWELDRWTQRGRSE